MELKKWYLVMDVWVMEVMLGLIERKDIIASSLESTVRDVCLSTDANARTL